MTEAILAGIIVVVLAVEIIEFVLIDKGETEK